MQVTPKITVITVVYNAKLLIEPTIISVLEQSYPDVEYMLIDGASTDGTMEIIEKYRSRIAHVSSEKDTGIYDAMNKGLLRATGEYVLFLNAGDVLASPDILKDIFTTPDRSADVYYGNTKIRNENGTILGDRRLKPPAVLTWKSLKFGMCVSHQSFIPKRKLCKPYNLNYKISADIDWVISILKEAEKIVNVNQTISIFLEGGTSAKSRTRGLIERFKIMTHYYGFIQTIFNHAYILIRYPFHKIFRKSMS